MAGTICYCYVTSDVNFAQVSKVVCHSSTTLNYVRMSKGLNFSKS
jgi:hypothetical protein